MKIDYGKHRQEDVTGTVDGYQLETYENLEDNNYSVVLREDRLGPEISVSKGLQEKDMQQLLEAARGTTPMKEVLEP